MEYNHCAVVKAGVPRSVELCKRPGKKIKLGSCQVGHDDAIADAMAVGDEPRAVLLAQKVVAAKAEFRDSISSTESLFSGSLQHESDYYHGTVMDSTQSSSRDKTLLSDDDYIGSKVDRKEEDDEYSDGSDDISFEDTNHGRRYNLTEAEVALEYEVAKDRYFELTDSEMDRELEVFQDETYGKVIYLLCYCYYHHLLFFRGAALIFLRMWCMIVPTVLRKKEMKTFSLQRMLKTSGTMKVVFLSLMVTPTGSGSLKH